MLFSKTIATKRSPRAALVILLTLAGGLAAQVKPATESPEALFERRVAGRADKVMERLALAETTRAAAVRAAVVRFYRDLHSAHAERDAKLAGNPPGDLPGLNRIQFEGARRSAQVYGELLGALSGTLDETQVEAVKDWMTFDMVPLSMTEYQRMFPALSARQNRQIHAWLAEAREAALVAGSAETKLDVFRVNKLRMNAYLGAQGLDVGAAVRAEEARKAAAQKPE